MVGRVHARIVSLGFVQNIKLIAHLLPKDMTTV